MCCSRKSTRNALWINSNVNMTSNRLPVYQLQRRINQCFAFLRLTIDFSFQKQSEFDFCQIKSKISDGSASHYSGSGEESTKSDTLRIPESAASQSHLHHIVVRPPTWRTKKSAFLSKNSSSGTPDEKKLRGLARPSLRSLRAPRVP